MALPVPKLLKVRARDTGQPNNLGAVLVDLNDDVGWKLQRGISWGGRQIREDSLLAPGYDGEYPTNVDRTNRQLVIPVKIMPQADYNALIAKWDALSNATWNKYFIVEFQPMYPAGGTAPPIYWFDCYKSPMPSLWDGADEPPVDHPEWLRTAATRIIQIQAAPDVRKSTGGVAHI